MPVPDCAGCLKDVERASREPHPVDRPVEDRTQTGSKLDVLANYFGAWPHTILSGLRRVGSRQPVHLWVFDLFAGRGWHESRSWPEGQRPGTAAAAGFRLWQAVRGETGLDVYAHLVAVEADVGLANVLQDGLDRYQHPRLEVRVLAGDYAALIGGLRRESLDGYSLWLFDPYGLRSTPLCVFPPLFSAGHTEVIVNLDAGAAVRVSDAVAQAHGAYALDEANSRTLDCLFGGDAWRTVPPHLTSTRDRQRWLAELYRDQFHFASERQALPLESDTGMTRFLVHAATHRIARTRFRKSYDETLRLWKRPRGATSLDLARKLAREFEGQEVTPALIWSLGVLPGVSLTRIQGACEHAVELGLATAPNDREGAVAFRPLTEQPKRPPGLFNVDQE